MPDRTRKQRGGLAWHPTPRPAPIRTSLFALGPPGALPETQAAYRDAIDGFAATDFVSVVLQMRPLAPTMTLGSSPVEAATNEVIAVVVLFPWVPAIETAVRVSIREVAVGSNRKGGTRPPFQRLVDRGLD